MTKMIFLLITVLSFSICKAQVKLDTSSYHIQKKQTGTYNLKLTAEDLQILFTAIGSSEALKGSEAFRFIEGLKQRLTPITVSDTIFDKPKKVVQPAKKK